MTGQVMPRHIVVDGSNLATEGRTMPSLQQLIEAVGAFMNENPEDVITVVVDATFGHRIDSKELAEFDAGGGDTPLVLSRDEVAELMRVFLPDGTNEARLVDQVDATIAKVADLGFLRRLKPAAGSGAARGADDGRYELRRILKAFVDAQWLADFDARLEVYRTALSGAAQASGAGDA